MSGTLVTINGEAYAERGLTFWGKRLGDTIGLVCSNECGAVELFEEPCPRGRDGGVMCHSPRDWKRFSGPGDCDILPGGQCWSDISFLAYDRDFRVLIERQDHAAVLRELATWHHAHFGPAA